MENLNGDLEKRVVVDTRKLEWTPSPGGRVWRRRVHRVGPAEDGQVTSVVRYQPDSTFPAHDHPDGEEILVLDGTFSDEHGDWPAGTHLLNPEGFRHAPFSREGCLLFVKLRQFPGADREHVVTDTRSAAWGPADTQGVEVLSLYEQVGFSDTTRLERWQPGANGAPEPLPDGAEIFVLEGVLEDAHGSYEEGTWLRLPSGSELQLRSPCGCLFYLKRGGLPYLESG